MLSISLIAEKNLLFIETHFSSFSLINVWWREFDFSSYLFKFLSVRPQYICSTMTMRLCIFRKICVLFRIVFIFVCGIFVLFFCKIFAFFAKFSHYFFRKIFAFIRKIFCIFREQTKCENEAKRLRKKICEKFEIFTKRFFLFAENPTFVPLVKTIRGALRY